MQAVILAAGRGSRLDSLTRQKPKCMVRVRGRPILSHQIQAYADAGIKDIIVVAGYKSNKIREYCQRISSPSIRIIENKDYDTTNNMYSLYLTKEKIAGKEFLLSNGDIIFDPRIVYELAHSKISDTIAGDRISRIEKHMKLTVDALGYVNNIDVASSADYINSVSLFRFSSASSTLLFDEISQIIEKENNVKDWFEIALQRLLKGGWLIMKLFDVGEKRWAEIDDEEDLLLADKLFGGQGE
ncbi:Bifunctional protein GlmU [subsurface metagenome]